MNEDPAFANRRAAARARLDTLEDGASADPTRRAWFHAVYDLAGADPAAVPWADLKPHPLLVDWLRRHRAPGIGLSALDVGCGLGDNAEALAARGLKVTAFDLVPQAIDWARRRFPGSAVDYQVADLFSLPPAFARAFAFVHECYTLQALPPAIRMDAMTALAACVAPGGHLLVITRARFDGDPVNATGPWPLTRAELVGLETAGLHLVDLEETRDPDDGRVHWRAEWFRET
jgi:SAM-dependent methyltransferase